MPTLACAGTQLGTSGKPGALDSRTPQKPPLCSGAESWASPGAAPDLRQPSPSSEPPPATPEPGLAQGPRGPPQEPEWCPGSSSRVYGAWSRSSCSTACTRSCTALSTSAREVPRPTLRRSAFRATSGGIPQLSSTGEGLQHSRGKRLDSKAEEAPHSAGTLTGEPHLQMHSGQTCPLHSPPLAFQGHPIPLGLLPWGRSGSSKNNLFRVPVGW